MRPSSSTIEPIAWLLAALLACPWDLALAAGTARAAPVGRSCVRPAGPGLSREPKRPHRGRIEPPPRPDDLDDPDDPGDVWTLEPFAVASQTGGWVAAGWSPLGFGRARDAGRPGFPVTQRLRC